MGIKFIGFICFIAVSMNINNSFATEKLAERVVLASPDKGVELLLQEDQFTNSWSQFDIDSRMHQKNSSKADLFALIKSQVKKWNKKEKALLISILKSIDQKIEEKGYHIVLPPTFYFVKTTIQEEGGAEAYTRANYVVLKDNILQTDQEALTHTIVHEIFHVLSRNNPQFRKEMYQVIGFELINEVAYPESIASLRITNPDAPQTDNYITVKVNGESVDCMMILYANKPYESGDFFEYLQIGFLTLEGEQEKQVKLVDQQPVIYSFEEVSDFFEQVGQNTEYIIHPEEIMADNFAFLILEKEGLPNPEISQSIAKILQK